MSSKVSLDSVKSEDHKILVAAYNRQIEVYDHHMGEIANNTDAIYREQLTLGNKSNEISTSLDNYGMSLDSVAEDVGYLSEQMDKVYDIFEKQTAKMIWILELQNNYMKNIIAQLQRPLDIKAKELRNRAIYAYINEWYDEALTDFLESLKYNPYDFTIHHLVGNIYLNDKNDYEKARTYYNDAVKYVLPTSKQYASFFILHISRTYYHEKRYDKAYNSTMRSIKLSPNYLEAKYQHAKNCILIDILDEAINIILPMIENKIIDPLSIKSDEILVKIRPDIRKIYQEKNSKLEASLSKVVKIQNSYYVKTVKIIQKIGDKLLHSTYKDKYLSQLAKISRIVLYHDAPKVSEIDAFFASISQNFERIDNPKKVFVNDDAEILKLEESIESIESSIFLREGEKEIPKGAGGVVLDILVVLIGVAVSFPIVKAIVGIIYILIWGLYLTSIGQTDILHPQYDIGFGVILFLIYSPIIIRSISYIWAIINQLMDRSEVNNLNKQLEKLRAEKTPGLEEINRRVVLSTTQQNDFTSSIRRMVPWDWLDKTAYFKLEIGKLQHERNFNQNIINVLTTRAQQME